MGAIEILESRDKIRDKLGLKWDKRHDTSNPKKYMFIEKNYIDEENKESVNGKGKKADVKPKPKPISASKLSPDLELQSLMQLILLPWRPCVTTKINSLSVSSL